MAVLLAIRWKEFFNLFELYDLITETGGQQGLWCECPHGIGKSRNKSCKDHPNMHQ